MSNTDELKELIQKNINHEKIDEIFNLLEEYSLLEQISIIFDTLILLTGENKLENGIDTLTFLINTLCLNSERITHKNVIPNNLN